MARDVTASTGVDANLSPEVTQSLAAMLSAAEGAQTYANTQTGAAGKAARQTASSAMDSFYAMQNVQTQLANPNLATALTTQPTPTPPVAQPVPTSPVDAATAEQRTSAFADFSAYLGNLGFDPTQAAQLSQWAKDTYTGPNAPKTFNEFYLQFKQTPQYMDRFGNTNQMRIKNGLPALSEGQIMSLESSYRDTMKAYNLPANFYDAPKDFQNFIANDLSASEVADRVDAAHAFVKLQDPQIRSQLEQYYGVTDGALTAAVLDPSKGQDILTQLASKNTAAIAAATAGMSPDQAQYALGIGAGKMSFNQQAQAFGQAGIMGQQGANLAAIYGQQTGLGYDTQKAMQETFNGPNAAQAQFARERLSATEKNTFGGASGVGQGSLGTDIVAGAI